MSRIGPVVTLALSCGACCYEQPDADGWWATCAAPTVMAAHGGPREIGVGSLRTPPWCPLRAQAIAEAVEAAR